MQEKLSTPICSISSEQRSVKQITPLTKAGGGRVDLIPTLMLFSGNDSLEIDGVGSVEVVGCDSFCESTSKRFDVKNNFLLICIFCEFGSEEEEERFLLLRFIFDCATNHFPDEEFFMVTSCLPAE